MAELKLFPLDITLEYESYLKSSVNKKVTLSYPIIEKGKYKQQSNQIEEVKKEDKTVIKEKTAILNKNFYNNNIDSRGNINLSEVSNDLIYMPFQQSYITIENLKGVINENSHDFTKLSVDKQIEYISTHIRKKGGDVDALYADDVDELFRSQGFEDKEDFITKQRSGFEKLRSFTSSTTKSGKSTKASQNILDKRKGSGMGPSKVTSKVFPTADGTTRVYTSGAKVEKVDPKAGDTSAAGMKAAKESLKGKKINIGGRNKGGLMTKNKKAKK